MGSICAEDWITGEARNGVRAFVSVVPADGARPSANEHAVLA